MIKINPEKRNLTTEKAVRNTEKIRPKNNPRKSSNNVGFYV